MSRAGPAGPADGPRPRRAPRIADLGFGQTHPTPGSGEVGLLAGGWIEDAEKGGPPLSLELRVYGPDGALSAETRGAVEPGAGGSFHAELALDAPPLWWLAGLGPQALHTVEARLVGGDGTTLDAASRRIGLRTLESRTREDGTRVLVCNGRPVFARGAVLAASEAPDAGLETVAAAAADASFNAIRLAPGARLPPEAFFDACDEAGIAVLGAAEAGSGDAREWDGPDFPGDDGGDPGADARSAASAGAMMLHPCLPDNPLSEPGDETGFETVDSVVSWASPETLEDEVPGALAALNGTEMTARTALRGGPPALAAALLAEWPMPKSPSGWVWLSQLAHASELHRRTAAARVAFGSGGERRPGSPERRTAAAPTGVFWAPLQSARAGADAASIDAAGRWKALHWEAARSFAPEAVFALGGPERDRPEAYRVCDGPASARATEFSWRLTAMDGETLAAGSSALAPGFSGAEALPLPDPAPFFPRRGRADLALWLSLRDRDGCVLSRDLALFAPPRALRLQDPELAFDVSAVDAGEDGQDGEQVFRVCVSASAPAIGVFLETPGVPALFEDSFFNLDPDEAVEIHVATLRRATESEFRAALRVRSLFDL